MEGLRFCHGAFLPFTAMATARPVHGDTFVRSHLVPNAAQAAHIRELLRSYAPPPINLSSTMSALSIEIARYDSEICRLRAQLAALEADQSALKAYHDDHGGFLAPVRRVPSEILLEIFQFLPLSFADALEKPPDLTSLKDIPTSRLAGMPLLAVSLVSARWHDIALGTPGLWNRITLDRRLWERLDNHPSETPNAKELLARVLDLGGKSLLDVKIITAIKYGPNPDLLHLLTTHSDRWKTVHLHCHFDDLRCLSSAKGKLPFLESLYLYTWDVPDRVPGRVLDTFGVAPRLRTLILPGSVLSTFAKPPLEQLHVLRCIHLSNSAELARAVSMMSGLPHESEFQLHLDFDLWDPSHDLDLNILPTSSEIAVLRMEASTLFNPLSAHCRDAFAAILTALTFPQLRELGFHTTVRPQETLSWLHSEFRALSARSSFRNHLETLQLRHLIVTETELLECLLNLPLLQRLEIADHEYLRGPRDEDPHHQLITDTLFSSLTRTADSPCLVPRLRSLTCTSLLRFDDTVYLNFLLSRIPEYGAFESKMRVIWGHREGLDGSVAARIQELRIQKRLVFTFAVVDPVIDDD
ncbi:hypothetical protein B0H11DRAFT_990118 [Mycena galericulata]|nr:hypothetical protein B0H11DRAFT_990118 [Mycena galericulata]